MQSNLFKNGFRSRGVRQHCYKKKAATVAHCGAFAHMPTLAIPT